MIPTTPGAPTTGTLDGAPAGQTFTAQLRDGTGVLANPVVVTARTDSEGVPLDGYLASFTAPSDLPVGLEWLDASLDRVAYETVGLASAIPTIGGLTTALLEDAPVGLTLTGRVKDGNETLPLAVTILPLLDSEGDPLDAYVATFILPAALPVELQWLEGATVVGSEIITAPTPITTDLSTDIGAFRLELGDLNPLAPLFTDAQISYYLALYPTSILLAVAAACDALAARFAREFDFDANESKSFKRSQKWTQYTKQAAALRKRVADDAAELAGVGVIQVTRVDSYSSTIGGRDGAGTGGADFDRTGRRSTHDYDVP